MIAKTPRERAVSKAREAFYTAIRTELALLPKERRCSPKCEGWFVADDDTFGMRIARCDECQRYREQQGGAILFDEDVGCLPEAEKELARHKRAELCEECDSRLVEVMDHADTCSQHPANRVAEGPSEHVNGPADFPEGQERAALIERLAEVVHDLELGVLMEIAADNIRDACRNKCMDELRSEVAALTDGDES